MGANKALIKIAGQPIIGTLVDQARPLTEEILVSANDPSAYRFLKLPVVPDLLAGCGPLAGLHAAMHWNARELYLVLACDLPNLNSSFLSRLLSLSDGFDATIPRTVDGVAHPLCAVYRRTCLPAIELALQKGATRFIDTFLADTLSVRWVSPEHGSYDPSVLANINTPEDLERLNHPFSQAPTSSTYSSSPSIDPDIL